MQTPLLRTLITALTGLALIVGLAFAAGDLDLKIRVNKEIQDLQDPVTPVNFALTVEEIEPNDDCSMANDYLDVTTGAIDPAGDEDWFAFEGSAGDCVTIGTDSWNDSTTDTQLYLYDAADCADPSAYLVWNDDGGPGLFSLISDYALPGSGTYYIRVKHYSSTGTGEYALSLATAACPQAPANDTCEAPILVACNTAITGTTEAANNDLEDLDESCVTYGANGPDVFYEVCVPPSHQLTVTLVPDSWDPALWFVLDCTDENTCVAGADAGFFNDPEIVSWVNESDAEVCLYIVPDGWNDGAFGPFALEITCDQVVPLETTSWGSVKAAYQE